MFSVCQELLDETTVFHVCMELLTMKAVFPVCVERGGVERVYMKHLNEATVFNVSSELTGCSTSIHETP